MINFLKSFVFRYTLFYVAMFVVSESLIFAVLYWSTVEVYETRQERSVETEAQALSQQFAGLSLPEMASIVQLRTEDEPGESDDYLLVTGKFEYVAGNVRVWPEGFIATSGRLDLGEGVKGPHHFVTTIALPTGHHLLVGRNLAELARIRTLIRKALTRTVALTIVVGLIAGFFISRRLAVRLDRINSNSVAILEGDLNRRMPLTGTGDEFDVLAGNLNRMLDRIDGLVRALREVTVNIAHDLRKPISRLRSRIEVVLMGREDPQAYRTALEETIAESDEVLNVFNALLTIATAESGLARGHFEELDLSKIVQSTVEIYGPLAEDAGIELVGEVDESVTILVGNPHLMTQAVANLVDNAIKHASGTTKIVVRAAVTPDHAELTVSDNGAGIPHDFRNRATERFTRMEQSRTTPGSGLGLSLVRAVALAHAGTISLGDNRPGLRVTLILPQL